MRFGAFMFDESEIGGRIKEQFSFGKRIPLSRPHLPRP